MITKKGIKDFFLNLFLIICFASLIFGFLYWESDEHDYDCLKEYAENFCNEKEIEYFNNNYLTFYCKVKEDVDPRITKKDWSLEKFYFLDEEIENCLVKEKNTFKRLR